MTYPEIYEEKGLVSMKVYTLYLQVSLQFLHNLVLRQYLLALD